jgi:hypothetical protein
VGLLYVAFGERTAALLLGVRYQPNLTG